MKHLIKRMVPGLLAAVLLAGTVPAHAAEDGIQFRDVSWNRTLGSPARFKTRWSICRTLSGEMGPPVGEGNTQELLPTFFFCCFRTAIVSSASGSVR